MKLFTIVIGIALLCGISAFAQQHDGWTKRERALIQSLCLDRLKASPKDPSNRLSDSELAASFGQRLFSDPRMSTNGKVSCASCHKSDYGFTDDLPLAMGQKQLNRRSMPLGGVAHQKWFFWDGKADSLWSQILVPLSNPDEHGLNARQCVSLIKRFYKDSYSKAVGAFPDIPQDVLDGKRPANQEEASAMERVMVNVAKSLAAFVHTIPAEQSRFDDYARAMAAGKNDAQYSPLEITGLKVFLGKGRCIDCHNGPLLSNGAFHHVGVPDSGDVDRGRAEALEQFDKQRYHYFSQWSDADPQKDGDHVRFRDTRIARYHRAFKTPSLRGVANRPPYMHNGSIQSLAAVLQHYNRVANTIKVDEITHDKLSDEEIQALIAFLESLNAKKDDD